MKYYDVDESIVYLMTDQTEQCRKCGARTNVISDHTNKLEEGQQIEQCPACGYAYILEDEEGKIKVKYVNIDDWNRPVFKDRQGNYYGSLNILFPYEEGESGVLKKVKVEDLVFFGRRFNCEPMGTSVSNLKIVKGEDW